MKRTSSIALILCLLSPSPSVASQVVSANIVQAPSITAAPGVMLSPAGPGLGLSPSALTPSLSAALPPASDITGAVTREHTDPGPVRKMWFVYGDEASRVRCQDMLQRVRAENPGVEVVELPASQAVPKTDADGALEPGPARGLFERLLEDKVELVLGTDHGVYEAFRSMRDSGYGRELPFGFAGRRYVSVDIARPSLDPMRLADPKLLPHRRYLALTLDSGLELPDPGMTGMQGTKAALKDVLSEQQSLEPKKSAKLPAMKELFHLMSMRLSGEADDKAMRELRLAVQRLAAYLERSETDVLLTDDPAVAALLAEMKREGYHLSLPVIWHGEKAPEETSALTTSIGRAGKSALAQAIREAPSLTVLPDNFGEVGGAVVRGYEAAVRKAMEAPGADPRTGEVVFLLTPGNGGLIKGDMNAYGHFGMAVKEPGGDHRVWTVHYMDRKGSSFTGGMGKSRLTLGEYLYSLHYLPGASARPSALAETSVGPVLAFVVRGISQAALESMNEMAAYLNATHLAGKDSYEYFNKGGLTNCISLVTKILRAAGIPVTDSGTQAPGDKAVEFIRAFARRLLENQVRPEDVDLIVFDRPSHSGSAYRIPNFTLGSPFFLFPKPWARMSLWEKIKAVLHRPLEFLRVPDYIRQFSSMATRRVVVASNSRQAVVEDLPASPLSALKASRGLLLELEGKRVRLINARRKLQETILKHLGMQSWQLNPGQTLEDLAKGRAEKLPPAEEAVLQRELGVHHELDVRLALNRFDGLLEERRQTYLKLRIAAPQLADRKTLRRMREASALVKERRDRIEAERRLPTDAEVEALARLNERAEAEMERLRERVLSDLGDAPAQDIRLIFRGQVNKELFEEIKAGREGEGPAPKK